MEDIKETILQQCLTIFKRDEVKEEFIDLMKPVIQMLLKEIYPYIFISIIFGSVTPFISLPRSVLGGMEIFFGLLIFPE